MKGCDDMGVRERLLVLRLMEKLGSNSEYAERIGVEMTINDDFNQDCLEEGAER